MDTEALSSQSRRSDPSCNTRPTTAGFSLPELIAVLVITGVLAAVAIPRFISTNSFDVFGFTEQTASLLRYAQKTAIAKRRYVCVQGNATQISVTFDPAAGGTQPCLSTSSRVLNPAGTQAGTGQNYVIRIPSGITMTSSPAFTTVIFDTQGRPVGVNTPLTLTISGGDTSRKILIEPETGYVH